MISPVIDDARVERNDQTGVWYVKHPTNGAILAYCDTKAEACKYRDYLNDAALHLRTAGFECS